LIDWFFLCLTSIGKCFFFF